MKLSAAFVKNVIPEDKPKKYFDGYGMYLFVKPNGKPKGVKYWRLDFRIDGKYKTLGLGISPKVSLVDARKKRDQARQLIDQNIDPCAQRKATKASRTTQGMNTLEIVAREWLEKQTKHWVPSHAERNTRRLESYIFPLLGNKPIVDITPKELLETLQRIENRGIIETAHRVKSLCNQIFDYAISTLRCTNNPAYPIRNSLQKTQAKHFATILDPIKIGKLLRAIDTYQGSFQIQCALKLAPLVFVRPNELRRAEWSEINLETALWTIPANKMKMKKPHLIPLSNQVVTIFQELKQFTGHKQFCFPGRDSKRPISETTLLVALRRMDYSTEDICVHGFRSMASTLLNEQGWNRDAIERQLAHSPQDKVRAAYNRAEYLDERKKMMQAWADYLDHLKASI
ncbi:MAG: tyrosine-type recombinase/integrase [Gammaproteobacteria bacterium]